MVQQKIVLSALQVLTSLFAYMRTLPDYPGVAPIQQQYRPMERGGGRVLPGILTRPEL